jgi:hypothetical protein
MFRWGFSFPSLKENPMSSSNFEILKSLVKRVLDGKHTDAHHRLQRVLGDSDRGLRLLDAQLEAEKLIACPALVK